MAAIALRHAAEVIQASDGEKSPASA